MSYQGSVVVVDPDDAERLADRLRDRGFDTVGVSDLEAAREVCEAHADDECCVVSTTSVASTARDIVDALATPRTPLVLVYRTAAEAAAALDAGATGAVPGGKADRVSDEDWADLLAAAVDRALREAARRSNRLLAQAVEAFPDACFVMDADGRVRAWNDRLVETTGLDDEALAATRPTDLFAPADGDRVEGAVGRAVMDGEASLVADLVGDESEPVPHELTLSRVNVDGGYALVGIARDVRVERYRETELERQRTQLETVYRVTSTVHDVMEELLSAESREAMLEGVCERFAADSAYRFAWIGSYDGDSDRVEPEAWAGAGAGYLEERSAGGEGVTALTALREERAVFVNDVDGDVDAEGWRDAALDHGHRAAAAIPIIYENAVYGCLCLYAGETDVFGELERTMLGDLGAVVGHALHAVETRRALTADTVTELQFRVTDPESFLVQVAERVEAELALVGSAGRPDGAIVQLFEVSGVTADRVREFAEQAPVPAEVVTEGDGECVIKVTQQEYSVAHVLAEVGGSVREVVVRDGDVTMTVDVPRSESAGDVLDAIRELYEVEFLSRREVDRESWTDVDYRAGVDRRLTARQEEVLEAAYRAGFFDWPREHTGEEVADILEVSPPTFHQHLRVAERKLLEVLFDRGPVGERDGRGNDSPQERDDTENDA